MRRAGLLLCALPVLAQEPKALTPPNIVFYAQREPTELGFLGGASGTFLRLVKGNSFFTFGSVYRAHISDATRFFNPAVRTGLTSRASSLSASAARILPRTSRTPAWGIRPVGPIALRGLSSSASDWAKRNARHRLDPSRG
jgi:hypothetical protein